MKTHAGLIIDDSRHYIDHLAPFCGLRGWPLITCEGTVADLARRFYPDLEIIEINRWDLKLPPRVVACDPRISIEAAFQSSPRELLWLPHGNSDKGWNGPIFEPLRGETALVYGQKMIDFMHQGAVFPRTIRVGNFRAAYWMKNQKFYDALTTREIPLPEGNRTYLYAPTWYDWEGNGSFWEILPLLTAHLPDDCSLIVKIHPNMQRQHEIEIERLIGKYAKRNNIFFLTDFPPVYPLLNICSAYIGDMSSIGYDFLYWNRPMFFLQRDRRSQFLYRCGIRILPADIQSIFERHEDCRFKEIRKEVYDYTFDSDSQYRP